MIFYLVGYMGCGKSSIGREVARRLGMPFIDMDREIEKAHDRSITEIFEEYGEDFFRKSEKQVLESIAGDRNGAIIATGGGAPCYEDNMELMNKSGKTIYLKLAPEKIVLRLKPGRAHRPKLNGMNAEQMLSYIRENLPTREWAYSKASMIVACDSMSDDAICGYIEKYVRYCEEREV